MKINGRKIDTQHIEYCVIPRGDDEPPIVFKAAAVLDMDDFDKLCPRPKPPVKILKGNKRIEDVEAPGYQAQLAEYADSRMNYLILKSLSTTEGLEWDTVDMSDPNTWKNYRDDLRNSYFSDIEVMRLINTVLIANCLSEDRLDKARDDFLASQLQASGK